MSPFLSAEWKYLLMLNYHVDPDLLLPYLPHGLELDLWKGKTFISVVGFLFHQTKILGMRIPWHTDFEEVNLRFYVRRKVRSEWRRGVVFIKEIVPRLFIASAARIFYGEPYVSFPMRHLLGQNQGNPGGRSLEYSWKRAGNREFLKANFAGEPLPLARDSEEWFITEQYWGYTARTKDRTQEYQVEHAPWKTWEAAEPVLECDAATLYGSAFSGPLSRPCDSAFVAEGSSVLVRRGVCFTCSASGNECPS